MTSRLGHIKEWIRGRVWQGGSDPGPVYADFSGEDALWIDRPNPDIGAFVSESDCIGSNKSELARRLHEWHTNGYVILKNAVSEALIDDFLGEMDSLIQNHKSSQLKVDIWRQGYQHDRIRKISTLSEDVLRGPHLKFLHVHTEIPSGLELATNPSIVGFLRAVFNDEPVVKQSLLFRYGSQQEVHQDYAYVVPSIPHHLAASWIALEDIKEGSGPLTYFEGSHRIPTFDFGNGTYLSDRSSRTNEEFLQHIARECEQRALTKKTLLIEKGDVLIWHAALAHGGEPIKDERLTRMSLVTHYTSNISARRPGWK